MRSLGAPKLDLDPPSFQDYLRTRCRLRPGLPVGTFLPYRSRSSLTHPTLTQSTSEERTCRPRLRFGWVWFRAGNGIVYGKGRKSLFSAGSCWTRSKHCSYLSERVSEVHEVGVWEPRTRRLVREPRHLFIRRPLAIRRVGHRPPIERTQFSRARPEMCGVPRFRTLDDYT